MLLPVFAQGTLSSAVALRRSNVQTSGIYNYHRGFKGCQKRVPIFPSNYLAALWP